MIEVVIFSWGLAVFVVAYIIIKKKLNE